MRIPPWSVPLLAALFACASSASAAAPVALTLDGPPPPVNFGWRPGTQTTDIVLKAARDMPADLKGTDLVVDVTHPLRRVGDTLVTVPAASVELGTPRLVQDRTDVPVHVAVKNAGLFWLGVVLVGLATLLLLAYKELRADGKVGFDAWLARAPAAVRDLSRCAQLRRFAVARRARFGVDFWVLECLLPLGVAVGAMYAVYATTTTWGADSLTAIFALMSTALAAAGVRSILVTAR